MSLSGINPQGKLVELKDHPWFNGVVPPRAPKHGGQAAPALHCIREGHDEAGGGDGGGAGGGVICQVEDNDGRISPPSIFARLRKNPPARGTTS